MALEAFDIAVAGALFGLVVRNNDREVSKRNHNELCWVLEKVYG